MKRVRIGCSGWNYKDWRQSFYPKGLPARLWLERYAEAFDTVEINNTFYRLPNRSAVEKWVEQTPRGFVFTVKASRYLTHVRRLRDPAEPVRRLLDAASGLGGKLGPVLLQLPPNFRADPALLDDCLGQFPAAMRVAVELRDPSWWTDATQEVLAARNAALCWADRRGSPVTPLWRTADWGYLRFHEGAASPWPRYGAKALRSWAQRIATAWPPGARVYAYFNNDQEGAAVHDAAEFARLTEEDQP